MSETKPPLGGKSADELLADMSMFLRDTFEELTNLYKAARDGTPPKEKDVVAKAVELRKWAQIAFDEKRKLDEFHGKHCSEGSGENVIDFAAVRVEIGRRLDRLRASESAGKVSE